MAKSQNNRQGERLLLSEWITTLPAGWLSTTHVYVGAQTLMYGGVRLTPAQQRAFQVWSHWADARIVTPSEIWIVEAKIHAGGEAYGQLEEYLVEYPDSADYRDFAPRPIVGVVVCQASESRPAARWLARGMRTIVYVPSFTLAQSMEKLFPGASITSPGLLP